MSFRTTSFCLAILAACPFSVYSQSFIRVSDVEVASCEATSFEETLTVDTSVPFDFIAYQLGFRFDPEVTEILDLFLDGTSILDFHPNGVDFFELGRGDGVGERTLGVLIELDGDPTEGLIPAGDHSLVRVRCRFSLAPDEETKLELVNGLGTPAKDNLFTNVEGASVNPDQLIAGTIRVVRPDGAVEVSGPASANDASDVVLEAMTNGCAEGADLQWRQIGGPTVEPLNGNTGDQFSFTIPELAGDATLVFEVVASNGSQEFRGESSIEVFDVASRESMLVPVDLETLEFDADEFGGLGQLLGFAGTVEWGSFDERGLWTALRLTPQGDLELLDDIRELKLYRDANGDGVLGSDDRLLVELEDFPRDGSKIDFRFSEFVSSNEPALFFVVVDTRSGTTAAVPAAVLLLFAGFFVGWKGRRALALHAVVLTFAIAGLVACSSGGGDGGGGGSGGTPAGGTGGGSEALSLQLVIADRDDVQIAGETTGLSSSQPGDAIVGPSLSF